MSSGAVVYIPLNMRGLMHSHIRIFTCLSRQTSYKVSHGGFCSDKHVFLSSSRLSTKVQKTRTVLVSESNNIYSNLAFEDWIYDYYDFQKNDVLFIWRNKPCVVIGRHQNPWTECDVYGCLGDDVSVARRRSGGGTVYHDMGNVNFTFFTCRKTYNRPVNLHLIVDAIKERWPINLGVTVRDDILLEDYYKVSGSSSKIGGRVAYHHCTLLLDVNKNKLKKYLQSNKDHISKSNATESVASPVKNLQELETNLTYENVSEVVARSYLQSSQVNRQIVDPGKSSLFQGMEKSLQELQSWKWIYGKTPKFTIDTDIIVNTNDQKYTFKVFLEINKGHIVEVSLSCDPHVTEVAESLERLSADLNGSRYWPMDFAVLCASEVDHTKNPIQRNILKNLGEKLCQVIDTKVG